MLKKKCFQGLIFFIFEKMVDSSSWFNMLHLQKTLDTLKKLWLIFLQKLSWTFLCSLVRYIHHASTVGTYIIEYVHTYIIEYVHTYIKLHSLFPWKMLKKYKSWKMPIWFRIFQLTLGKKILIFFDLKNSLLAFLKILFSLQKRFVNIFKFVIFKIQDDKYFIFGLRLNTQFLFFWILDFQI